MSNIVIKAENLGKAYQLGEFTTGTLSRDIERYIAKLRGKEDPFLSIGQTNDRTKKSSSDIVWSLKDINFEIEQGQAIGVIGRNGAGKSTLLKVLSRVTSPTLGSIKVKGRIASLLEVGTGFHPELTGRENIFLNGAILGMRKSEIKKHFDAIVDFAAVERYVDTPVKRYSSGMYVRLAFAVAAYLESEILIVDEVLAVGDAEFQNKCLSKMNDVSKGEGRTVLFVSHNMASITNLCSQSILLQNGSIADFGNTRSIVDKYATFGKASKAELLASEIKVSKHSPVADFLAFRLVSKRSGITSTFDIDENIYIEFEYFVKENDVIVYPSIHLLDSIGDCMLATFNGPSASLEKDSFFNKKLPKGKYKSTCVLPGNFLNDKSYSLSFFLVTPGGLGDVGIAPQAINFTIAETGEMRKEFTGEWAGVIRPKLHWKTEAL